MKIPFLNIFNSPSKKIPEKITRLLLTNFPNAINIDWEIKDKVYEAVFYVAQTEHIAMISELGELIEYKKNMWPDELSVPITHKCLMQGEIMNAICIFKNNTNYFEVIVRDKNFNRTQLVFDENALLLESKKL